MSVLKSLNRWALFALFFGIFIGIFFGPLAGVFLKPLGNAFSMLLQMAVFPYICFSLILGLGSMTPKEALLLLKRGVPFIVGIWLLAIFYIYFLSQMIPPPTPPLVSAETGSTGNFRLILEYLTPVNGFYALANNFIISGLLLSLLFGAALMNIEKKEFLIPYLERSLQILDIILRWILLISPIAVFIYISIAFGTIEFDELLNIDFYVLARIFISVFFAALIIPLIISNFMNISIYQSFQVIKETCLIPFLSGSPAFFVPFILFREQGGESEKETSGSKALQVIIPFVYCLAQVGSSIIFFLSSFLCFYYRISMSLLEKIMMYLLFAPITFGEPTTVFNMPFFMGHFNFPITAIQLDKEAALLIHHFLVLMSISSVLAIILIVRAAYLGALEIRWKRLASSLSASSFCFIAVVYAAKPFVHLHDYYEGVYQNLTISDIFRYPVSAKIFLPGETGTPRDPLKSTLQQVIETGILKVGIEDFEVPYSYLNSSGELVGYDIAFAYQLARDLDCSIEFIVVDADRLGEQLSAGDIDIGMSSFLMTENRLKSMEFSQPSFQEEDNVLIVPRTKKDEFLDFENLRERNIKILTGGAYTPIAKNHFPNAEIIPAHGLSLLKNHTVDATFWARTSGFVWCILNPEFVVIDYGPPLGRSYFAYPVRENALDFIFFLNNWLRVKEQIGFKNKMIQYWIQGQRIKKNEPRWSILRNVLHVVE